MFHDDRTSNEILLIQFSIFVYLLICKHCYERTPKYICAPQKVVTIRFVCRLKYFPGAQTEVGGILREPRPEPLTQKSNPQGSGVTLRDAVPW